MYSRLPTQRRSLLLLLIMLLVSSLSACTTGEVSGAQAAAVTKTVSAVEVAPRPTKTELSASPTSSPTPIPPQIPRSIPGRSTRMLVSGDEASVPILLYHHVSDEKTGYRYYIGTAAFRKQMQALHDDGWTTITTAGLANMLRGTAPLPEKALVISFDDGALDVYKNAFPVMQEMDFQGVFFLVSSAIGADGYAKPRQLREMIAAGWEMGSHSMTHSDLSKEGVDLRLEMYQSAVQLETALDIPVQSFAYPFSAGSENLYRLAPMYGYTNAACAGWSNRQSTGNLYCLSRREVTSDMTPEDLLRLVSEP